MPGDKTRSVVPTVLDDPGFQGVNRAVRVLAVAGVALLFVGGLWAWFFFRPVAPVVAAQPAQSARPAIDVESTDVVLTTPTPFVAVVHTSVLAQQVPILALTPRPAPKATAVAIAQAPPPPAHIAEVPRVLTSAEVASSRMNLETPEAPAAPGTTNEGALESASVASPPAHPATGPHASFFSEQSNAVGYESEDGECIVRATSAIAARLVTRVDSSLPAGVVKAEIVTPVDCSNGKEAIPAGAILQGTYDSSTTSGESRLVAVFSRIIFPPTEAHPNGRAYAIGAQSATGPQGETGLGGRVDSGAGKAFGQAVLYTLLGAVGNAIGSLTSHGGTTIGLGGTSVTGQFVPGAQRAKPTIFVDAGAPVDVVLARDLPMEPVR